MWDVAYEGYKLLHTSVGDDLNIHPTDNLESIRRMVYGIHPSDGFVWGVHQRPDFPICLGPSGHSLTTQSDHSHTYPPTHPPTYLSNTVMSTTRRFVNVSKPRAPVEIKVLEPEVEEEEEGEAVTENGTQSEEMEVAVDEEEHPSETQENVNEAEGETEVVGEDASDPIEDDAPVVPVVEADDETMFTPTRPAKKRGTESLLNAPKRVKQGSVSLETNDAAAMFARAMEESTKQNTAMMQQMADTQKAMLMVIQQQSAPRNLKPVFDTVAEEEAQERRRLEEVRNMSEEDTSLVVHKSGPVDLSKFTTVVGKLGTPESIGEEFDTGKFINPETTMLAFCEKFGNHVHYRQIDERELKFQAKAGDAGAVYMNISTDEPQMWDGHDMRRNLTFLTPIMRVGWADITGDGNYMSDTSVYPTQDPIQAKFILKLTDKPYSSYLRKDGKHNSNVSEFVEFVDKLSAFTAREAWRCKLAATTAKAECREKMAQTDPKGEWTEEQKIEYFRKNYMRNPLTVHADGSMDLNISAKVLRARYRHEKAEYDDKNNVYVPPTENLRLAFEADRKLQATRKKDAKKKNSLSDKIYNTIKVFSCRTIEAAEANPSFKGMPLVHEPTGLSMIRSDSLVSVLMSVSPFIMPSGEITLLKTIDSIVLFGPTHSPKLKDASVIANLYSRVYKQKLDQRCFFVSAEPRALPGSMLGVEMEMETAEPLPLIEAAPVSNGGEGEGEEQQ